MMMMGMRLLIGGNGGGRLGRIVGFGCCYLCGGFVGSGGMMFVGDVDLVVGIG